MVLTVLSHGLFMYVFAKPISYEEEYRNGSIYEDDMFEGAMRFYADGTVINRNTNFGEEMKLRYYYKDGYVFITLAETDEEYEEEVAYINGNFEEAINSPFYASRINPFRMVSKGVEGFETIYTCAPAVFLAVALGFAELVLISFTIASFILIRKQNKIKGEL